MKTNLFHKLTAAVCALALLLSLAPTALAANGPASSNNIYKHNFGSGTGPGTSQNTVTSYLFENSSGGLTRVEYLGTSSNTIIVEDYNSSFQLQSSRTIPFELSKWGGFFAGAQYNFFIFGQDNPNESDSVETIRVVKYDKNWNRLGQYSLMGGNIQKPFQAATVRCAEYGGSLYIHTARTMYKRSDGKNHQANMTLQIRESDMSLIRYLDTHPMGYVSHSFNQFILVDAEQRVVTLNHGDGYPRAAVVMQFTSKAGPDPIERMSTNEYGEEVRTTESEVYHFFGEVGNNGTDATTGGFAETRTGYVTAITANPPTSGYASRKVYLGYTTKDGLKSSTVEVSTTPCAESVPYLAPTSLDGGWIMWNGTGVGTSPRDMLYYTTYTANGSTGTVQTATNAPLSDCQPIQYNGKTVWYTTNDSAPVFYTLDASGVTMIDAKSASSAPSTPNTPSLPSNPSDLFTDVSANHWAIDAIRTCSEQGVVNGLGDGRFDPDGQVTSAQFIVMLTRMFYNDKVEAAKATETGSWYAPNLKAAADAGITNRLSTVNETAMTRCDMAMALYNVIDQKGKALDRYDSRLIEAAASLKDWSSVPLDYQRAVMECCAQGIITGMSDRTFSGSQTMTRAQACTVMARMMKLING